MKNHYTNLWVPSTKNKYKPQSKHYTISLFDIFSFLVRISSLISQLITLLAEYHTHALHVWNIPYLALGIKPKFQVFFMFFFFFFLQTNEHKKVKFSKSLRIGNPTFCCWIWTSKILYSENHCYQSTSEMKIIFLSRNPHNFLLAGKSHPTQIRLR